MDNLDVLLSDVDEANSKAENIAEAIRSSDWSGEVDEVTEGDQVSDASVYLSVPTDAEDVRLQISPDGSVILCEGYGIESEYYPDESFESLVDYLNENYS